MDAHTRAARAVPDGGARKNRGVWRGEAGDLWAGRGVLVDWWAMPSSKEKGSSRPYKMRDGSESPRSERAVLAARVGWMLVAAAWVFVLAGLVSFDAGDAPSHAVWPHHESTRNWTGPVGAHIAYGVLRVFGLAAAVPMAFVGVLLALRLAGRAMTQPVVRFIGALVCTAALSTLIGVAAPGMGALPGLGGGTLGLVGAGALVPRFAVPGTLVWVVVLAAIGLLVCCDRYLWVVPMMAWRRVSPALARTGERAGGAAESAASRANKATHAAGGGLVSAVRGWLSRRGGGRRVRQLVNDLDGRTVEVEAKPRASRPARRAAPEPELEDEYEDDGYEYEYEDEYEQDGYEDSDEDAWEDDEAAGAPQVFDRDKLREKIEALPVRFAQDSRSVATDEDLAGFQAAQNLDGYRFPTLDLLEDPDIGFNETLESLVRQQAESLEGALRQFRIDGEVVDIESGPAITLYHIRLAPGTKVSQLNAISSDLARSLKAVNIRVVSNIEGRDTVGIEVPNEKKERVRLKELMSNRSRFEAMKLPMFLGKDAGGEPLIADLTKMPHMLIAGTTGSGKSVCMNTIIMSFMYTMRPDELKLVLVDPKMVEMSQFKDIPHLMCPVVTEMPKAAAILEWAVTKMDERYELLADAGVRDISGYNALGAEELRERLGIETDEQMARVPKTLPYMVFIIDELADLMMTNKEVEGSIIRIAQKARAVGIHLILATQRPQANVVTGLIKSNMPCRVAFKVASGMDSRIVLDHKGGEVLLGQGDMLFLAPSSTELTRAQGTLVDDAEIRMVVRFLRDIAAPSFERSLMQVGTGDEDEDRVLASENNSSASLAAAQEDPMFDRAVEIVLETKRGSVSLLQRRLAIGYTRASRLIDLMGIAGIISDHKGSVARDVMISLEEWEMMKEMAREMEREQRRGVSGDASGDASGVQAGGDPEDPHQTTIFDAAPGEGVGPESAPFEHDGEAPGVVVHASAVDDDVADPEDAVDDAVEDEGDDEADDGVDDGDDEADDEAGDEDSDAYEYEYEYVDEDGNPIDPADLEDEEDGDEDEEAYDGDEDEDVDGADDAYEGEEEDEDEPVPARR